VLQSADWKPEAAAEEEEPEEIVKA
jgi:hypothetical protein